METTDVILARALAGRPPTTEEISDLLAVEDEPGVDRLFAAARELRTRHFGNRVFLYGFAFFSTHCRNDCLFCHFRVSNTALPRYRKTVEQIIEAAQGLASGVHLLDLTMGEDPHFYATDGSGFGTLVEVVGQIRRLGLPVMVSPGAVPLPVLPTLAAAGADWFACYQETHDLDRFDHLRPRRDYQARLEAKIAARAAGMLIEEGLLCGTGETRADLAHSIQVMSGLDPDQVRVMTFIPQPGTPLAQAQAPDFSRELKIIAVLRLAFPDRLIPASLDVDGLAGLKARLRAGANVVTSLVSPGQGWAGVAHSHLDIEEARRTPEAVRPIIEECGLEPASREDYAAWMASRRTPTRSEDRAGRVGGRHRH